MAETASCPPSQADGSGSIAVAPYKATVQAVLLFGSETWKLSPLSLKSLEGIQIRAARRMAGMKPARNPDGTWTYPNSKEVLKAVGLKTIGEYINVRKETIARFIVD